MTRPQATTQQHRGLGLRKQRRRRGRIAAATIASSCLVLGVVASQAGSPAVAHSKHHHNAFVQRNLVSDLALRAEIQDTDVKNPWGIAFGPATPIWVNNNFNPAAACDQDCGPAPEALLTQVTLYRGATRDDDPVVKVDLEVTASSPTGIVFNPSSSFLIDQGQGEGRVPARFLFNEAFFNAAADGAEARITGWSPATTPPNPSATTSTAARKNHVFATGLALVPGKGDREPRLLTADGSDSEEPSADNRVAIYDEDFEEVAPRGRFVDPRADDQKLAPYNVMYLGGRVYVTYTDGESISAISVFKPGGRFIKRLVTSGPKGPLVGPWGMAIAPEHWGRFGGDLIVGNVFDGKIHAFDRHDGDFEGTLRNAHGKALVNPGLWGIAFGNGVIGTPRTLLFAAGIGSGPDGGPAGPPDTPGDDVYFHGLVGLIKPMADHHDD